MRYDAPMERDRFRTSRGRSGRDIGFERDRAGGYGMRSSGYDREISRGFGPSPRGGAGYDRELGRGFRPSRPRAGYDQEIGTGFGGARQEPGYGGDYWWLGEHELDRQGIHTHYDEAYRRFDRMNHPRFSPVGGMYPAWGGEYSARRPPRAIREPTRFSDWTRWF